MTDDAFHHPTFASERLAMRPMAASDAEALHELYRDDAAMRWWSSPPHATLTETIAYVTPQPGAPWRGWVMTIVGDDTAIGTLSARETKPAVFEIGYALVPRHAGHGYAREGVARLIDLLVRDEDVRRIWADIDPDNVSSCRLVEGLGFQCEGRLRAMWKTHIGVRDTLVYASLADEWLSSSASTRA